MKAQVLAVFRPSGPVALKQNRWEILRPPLGNSLTASVRRRRIRWLFATWNRPAL